MNQFGTKTKEVLDVFIVIPPSMAYRNFCARHMGNADFELFSACFTMLFIAISQEFLG